jgi:aldehyde dehydrogenase (NAD+)
MGRTVSIYDQYRRPSANFEGAAGSRIYVQAGVYDRFLSLFKEEMRDIVIGDPFDNRTYQGPQISQVQFDRIMGYIQSARDEGATIEVGGERFGNEGFFIHPTVITNAAPNARVVQEEIFGPVVVINKFDTFEDAVKLGNSTELCVSLGLL